MPTAITDWGSAMMTSLAAALAMFLSAIPKIIGFALIVVAGWLLSSLVERGIAAILRAVRFNDLATRSGLADFINKMGTGTDSSGMIGIVAKWFIRLIALVVAFDALGLPAVSEVLRDLLLWLPNVVVALVVLVIGGLAAKALSNLVRGAMAEAGLTNSNLLAKLAGALVWAFAIVVAVNQIGIATTLVNTLFMAFVGAIALGLGLSFGLGGRETAGRLVNQWYEKAREKGPQLAHAVEAGGDVARHEGRRMPDEDRGRRMANDDEDLRMANDDRTPDDVRRPVGYPGSTAAYEGSGARMPTGGRYGDLPMGTNLRGDDRPEVDRAPFASPMPHAPRGRE